MFEGPRWYGLANDPEPPNARSPDAESDLIALVDGEVLLCEVKASWRALNSSDIPKLVSLAKRLRPDIALLAVMEGPGGPADQLAAAKTDLQAEGIEFRVMTLESNQDAYDSPYLM